VGRQYKSIVDRGKTKEKNMESNKKNHWLLFIIFCFIGLSLSSNTAFSAPEPSITANSGSQRILVMPSRLLNVVIELNPGSSQGQNADWWLLALTPDEYFHYDPASGWLPGFEVSYQGPITTLPPWNVLSLAGLPAGTYYVGFGIDLNMNGTYDDNDTYLDIVEITASGYVCPDTANSLDALSETQKAFITSKGNPDMFILGFASEDFDEENRAAYLADNNIRRIEHWLYNEEQLTMFTFDSGYFVKETVIGNSISDLQSTPLSPSQFSPCTTQAEIIELLGTPSCVNTEILAGRTYNYLRYNPTNAHPATTIVTENGYIISALVGYSFDLDSSPLDGNLCTDCIQEEL
jgi:hypothetical protein